MNLVLLKVPYSSKGVFDAASLTHLLIHPVLDFCRRTSDSDRATSPPANKRNAKLLGLTCKKKALIFKIQKTLNLILYLDSLQLLVKLHLYMI